MWERLILVSRAGRRLGPCCACHPISFPICRFISCSLSISLSMKFSKLDCDLVFAYCCRTVLLGLCCRAAICAACLLCFTNVVFGGVGMGLRYPCGFSLFF